MKKAIHALMLVLLTSILCIQSYAQEKKTVSGTVRDNEGKPVPSVTVVEKGTSNKTITSAEGIYSIRISPGAKLVFSSIGFDSYEIAPSGNSADVQLALSTRELTDVVVTAFGIQKQQKSLGYATQLLKHRS